VANINIIVSEIPKLPDGFGCLFVTVVFMSSVMEVVLYDKSVQFKRF
jgi:hypothetical protein